MARATAEPGMERAPDPARTTPKDFFLWLGAVIALYAAVTSFLGLLFSYIDIAFPDPLSYGSDPYSSGIRIAMATLIVTVPVMLSLFLIIRRDIVREPLKAHVWVRRWALVLTIFLAVLTAAVDLVTLLTTFLNGDLSAPFALKALTVLLVSIFVCLHFFADYRGYWTLHRRKADLIAAGVGAVAFMTIAAGFVLIGSPSHARAARFDAQRVSDLENIQSEVITYWQREHQLPASLDLLNDSLSGYQVPTDPQSRVQYEYAKSSGSAFTLCATFSTASDADRGRYQGDPQQQFAHGSGHACFSRTIDPSRYPALPSTVS